jgi:hypothetical protein
MDLKNKFYFNNNPSNAKSNIIQKIKKIQQIAQSYHLKTLNMESK